MMIQDRMADPTVRERAVQLLDRMVVTAAEGALLAIGGETVTASALTFDWPLIGGYALAGAFLSLCINLARGGITGRKAT